MGEAQRRAVPVPAELYARLSELLGESGADSVDELVARILRDWVSREGAKGSKKAPPPVSAEDQKIVEDRLKSLGYC